MLTVKSEKIGFGTRKYICADIGCFYQPHVCIKGDIEWKKKFCRQCLFVKVHTCNNE